MTTPPSIPQGGIRPPAVERPGSRSEYTRFADGVVDQIRDSEERLTKRIDESETRLRREIRDVVNDFQKRLWKEMAAMEARQNEHHKNTERRLKHIENQLANLGSG